MSLFLISFSPPTLRSLLALSDSREGRLCVSLSFSSTRHSSLACPPQLQRRRATRHFGPPITHSRSN